VALRAGVVDLHQPLSWLGSLLHARKSLGTSALVVIRFSQKVQLGWRTGEVTCLTVNAK
jgi:hypothetical protein